MSSNDLFFFYQQKCCINKKERDVLKFCLYLQENLHDNFIEFKINFDLFLFKVVWEQKFTVNKYVLWVKVFKVPVSPS